MLFFHFAPTELSRRNLQREGVADGNIYVVGNTVIDALHLVLEQIGVRKDIEKNIQFVLERVGIPLSLLSLWKSGERKMVLITGHRRENFGEGFIHICKAIKTLAEKYSMVDFVYPMHLNRMYGSRLLKYWVKAIKKP